MKKEFDFEITEVSLIRGLEIITDKKTGIQYLSYKSGIAGGLTPLLDKEGKPQIRRSIVNKENEKDH